MSITSSLSAMVGAIARRLWPRQLFRQIVLTVLIVVALASLGYAAHTLDDVSDTLEKSVHNDLTALAKNIAISSAGFLLANDYAAVEELLLRMAEYPGIERIEITRVNGNTVSRVVRGEDDHIYPDFSKTPHVPHSSQGAHRMSLDYPIKAGAPLGSVHIDFSLEALTKVRAHIWEDTLIAWVLTAGLTVISLTLLLRRPARVLAQATAFAEGLDTSNGRALRIAYGNIEFEKLCEAMNRASLRLFEQQQALKNSSERIEAILENAADAIIVIDDHGFMETFNYAAEKMFGYDSSAIIGRPMHVLLPPKWRYVVPQALNRSLFSAAPQERLEAMGLRRDGSSFSIELSVSEFHLSGTRKLIGIIRDITERKQFETQILHQATHDALTGLPNRVLFHDILAHVMPRVQRTGKLLAVMFLDLDGFKNINDTLGHEYGDILLKEIAQRLARILRTDDMIARQGGDEFTIFLQDISAVEDIIQIAEKILAVVAEPFLMAGHEMHVTASIGITVFPIDDMNLDSLLRNADTAMYRAKELGKNNFQFYTAQMNTLIRERMEIENLLHHALARKELLLHYQPQINLKTGKIVAVEALLRWNHPTKGMVPPEKFIPVAEESGLIVSIGEWVLYTACRQNKAWRDAGLPHIRMAVNLSARQFRQPHLATVVAKAMASAEIDPRSGSLELELTESMIMYDMGKTVATLHELHNMGVRLSIDDFGTGYSSLSYLKRFPISALKIDQSFVQDITTDADAAAIASTVVMLANSLKLSVVAEGVETAEQLASLRNMECDEAQGYYFSEPLPPEKMETLLRNEWVWHEHIQHRES